MRKIKQSKWVWYLVLVAVVCGLFAPTMVANAITTLERSRCPLPAQGDILN